MDHLINSFMSQASWENTTVGLTQYIFWMFVAIALLFIVLFVFKKKQAASARSQGFFVNGVEFVVEFARDDICKAIPGRHLEVALPPYRVALLLGPLQQHRGHHPRLPPAPAPWASRPPSPSCSFVYFIVMGVSARAPWATSRAWRPRECPSR